jgi:hypothetical protein
MSQLETLNTRYGKLERLISAIEEARRVLLAEEREQLKKVLEKYFTAEKGDVVRCTYGSVQVSKEGSDRGGSFIDIYTDYEWNDDEEKEYRNFYIINPYFRTDKVDEEVAEIFEKQAYYTRIVVDFQDDILAEMNHVCKHFNNRLDEVCKPLSELRKETRELEKQIQAIEKEARFKALMSEEGLEIKGVHKTRYNVESTYIEYPDLQVKFDWTLRSIRGLRIDKVSASGKSADITVKIKRWDHIMQEEVLTDEKIERVRMDNIESFLRYNKISI